MPYPVNEPVRDFYCRKCHENFQVKGSKNRFSTSVQGGADTKYRESLRNGTYPSMILVQYDGESSLIQNVMCIHRSSLTLNSIKRRKKLSSLAVRHGFQGCTINLRRIPKFGRIELLKNGVSTPLASSRRAWNFAKIFLTNDHEKRSWITDLASLVEELPAVFSLTQVYQLTSELRRLHPSNKHIKDKIRQQLQYLRNHGIVEFLGSGVYRHSPSYWK